MSAVLRLLRLCRPTPNGVLIALPIAEGFLFASDHYDWFEFNRLKGCTILVAIALAAVTLLGLLSWFLVNVIRRGKFQFGVRSLLLLVTAFALLLGWLGGEMQAARQHQAIVQELTDAGFKHKSNEWLDDYYSPYKSIAYGRHPEIVVFWARWLDTRLPRGFFAEVESLYVYEDIHHRGDDPDLRYDRIDDRLLAATAIFPRLQRIDLRNTAVTDTGLKHLRRQTALGHLCLHGTAVTDAGLEALTELPDLSVLILSKTQVRGTFLRQFRSLPQLSALELQGTRISDAEVSVLQTAERLWTLDLSNTSLTDDGLSSLSGLPRLTHLDLSGTSISDRGMKTQATMSLVSLALARTAITDAGLGYFPPGDTLHELDLADTKITDVGLQTLTAQEGLKELNLARTSVSDEGLKSFEFHPGRFEALNLAGTRVTGVGLDYLAPGIYRLDLSGTKITDDNLHFLRHFRSLGHLSLADTAVTDAGLPQLRRLTNLLELNLAGAKVTDAGLVSLTTLKNLCTLNLSRTAVTPNVAKSLPTVWDFMITPEQHAADSGWESLSNVVIR